MKLLSLYLIFIMNCSPCKAEGGVAIEVYPFIKSNIVYTQILKHFCMHPSYVNVQDEENKRTVTTLAAFTQNGEASVNWSNFIEFTMVRETSSDQYKVTAFNVLSLGELTPCFMPNSVVIIGSDSSLIEKTMNYTERKLQIENHEEPIFNQKRP